MPVVTFSRIAIALGLWLGLSNALAAPAEDDFRPLFNGRDFTGWVNVNCAPDTWQVTNGLIFCTGKPIGELRTTRMYQNFVLELEWRHLKPQGNAGVFVWADALTSRGQPFIRGIEVQVLDGRESPNHTSDGDIFPIHGAKMVPINGRGGDRAFPIEKRAKPSPEWNHYRIECANGAISLSVNGKIVTRGHSASPRKGYICLESEGSPVEFRNVRLRELPNPQALNPEDIANPDEGFRSLYSGVDLRGWQSGAESSPAWQVKDWTLEARAGEGLQPLVAEGEFGDGVLVFDWRWTDARQPGKWTQLLELRGKPLGSFLSAAAAETAEIEVPAGRWNRGIVRIRGNRVSVEVNGRELGTAGLLEGILASGTLALNPAGVPAQIANLFWKTLD
jgi:hypothetical protein